MYNNFMREPSFLLYGHPTKSDMDFFLSETISMSLDSLSSSSSTRSDAQSAPPELADLFNRICQKSEELLRLRNKEFPPEWSMADLIRAVMGEDSLQMAGLLKNTFYDVILRGETRWLFEDLCNFLDLINYAI
jgi:hypothetical protein